MEENNIILEEPLHGWSRFQALIIDDGSIRVFEKSISYITDVLVEFLNAAVHSLKTGADFTMSFECESEGSFKIVADDCDAYIIDIEDETKLYEIAEIGKYELITAIYNSIIKCKDLWVEFTADDVDSYREELIYDLFAELKSFSKDSSDK